MSARAGCCDCARLCWAQTTRKQGLDRRIQRSHHQVAKSFRTWSTKSCIDAQIILLVPRIINHYRFPHPPSSCHPGPASPHSPSPN
jgi:hypothetical protein